MVTEKMVTEKDVLDAMSKDEHERSEFKANTLVDGDLAEYIMSFAHRDGGAIYCGIDPMTMQPNEKIGRVTHNVLNGVNRAANDCLSPPVFGVTAYDVIVRGKHILVVQVPKSNRIHQHRNGKILIRRGSENVAYSGTALEQAIQQSHDLSAGYDSRPLQSASTADIDYVKLQEYVVRVLKRRPDSTIANQPRDDILKGISAIAESEGFFRPTPVGLLFFSRDPQHLLPQARVVFLQFAGTDVASGDGRGGPYLENQEFCGTLPDMIEKTQAAVFDNMRKRAIMNGAKREEIPEYPNWAIRESVVNAIAHRDYSLSGSKIQISMFADRIEVQSPGGLPGNITVDNIESEQFTRNQGIMRLLEEFGFVEERGIGVDNMIRAMRDAGLEPPIFQDSGTSVTIILKNVTLLDDETINWLSPLADAPLNHRERMALAFLRRNPLITNQVYQRINNVDSVQGTHDLSELVVLGLLRQHGTRGGAYYTLAVDWASIKDKSFTGIFEKGWAKEAGKIIGYLIEKGRITNTECRELLGTNAARAHYLLRSLARIDVLQPIGERKNRYYTLSKRRHNPSRKTNK
jgi:ATP-dependent DNA helicase RecG